MSMDLIAETNKRARDEERLMAYWNRQRDQDPRMIHYPDPRDEPK